MGEAEERMLKMLEDGLITAGEADNLLRALDTGWSANALTRDVPVPGEGTKAGFYESGAYSETAGTRDAPPEMDRFRRLWPMPFFIATGSLLLSGLGLLLMYQAAGEVALIGFLCLWSIFVIAFLAVVLVLLARRAPWLHVRVQEKDGRRIAISLPLPLHLANWGLNLAKYIMPKEQSVYLKTAAVFVDEMKRNPDQEPIIIDVDDDDGDKVQLYFG